jgi:DNA-directed RNA polymerase subunit RPC12/RpoP
MDGEDTNCTKCGKEFIVVSSPPVDDFKYSFKPAEKPKSNTRIACPMCGEMIMRTAKICRFCRHSLTGDNTPQEVKVAQIDPSAIFHTDISGKKKGKLSFIGILGVLLGTFFIIWGAMQLPEGNGFAGFVIMLKGILIGVFCYLWARRKKKKR